MSIEYFQQTRRIKPLSGEDDLVPFEYKAFGPERLGHGPFDDESDPPTSRRPVAEVTGYHRSATYSPTFAHGSPDFGGYTYLYLKHKKNELVNKHMTHGWTSEEEQNAYEAANHFLRRNQEEEPDRTEWALNQLQTNPHLTPTKLFEDTPPKTHISGMFADPSMSHVALTLAGMAYEQHGKAPIETDKSLSYYSSRIAQKAIKRGLPVRGHEDNPEAEVTNDIDLEPRTVSTGYAEIHGLTRGVKRSTPEEIRMGRQAVREMLRGTRKRNPNPVANTGLSDQFLPGMEKYA